MIAEYLESLPGDSASNGWVQRETLCTGLTFYDSTFSAECLKNLAPLQPQEMEILLCMQGRMEIQLAERRMQFVGPGDLVILAQTSQVPAFSSHWDNSSVRCFISRGRLSNKIFRKASSIFSLGRIVEKCCKIY